VGWLVGAGVGRAVPHLPAACRLRRNLPARTFLCTQFWLSQSLSVLQSLSDAHAGQDPPQSTSVSSWFFLPSEQIPAVGALVGASVGILVGEAVGEVVGATVGMAVGSFVGLAVGI